LSYDYIIHLADYSDGVLYVLAALLLLALAVIIDRFWSLRITIMRGGGIIDAAAAHGALSRGDLESCCAPPAACRKPHFLKPRSATWTSPMARRW
jgi:hypothetical protein